MSEPTTYRLERGDLSYIVDALLDAAEARRKRTGRLQERIADHLEGLALDLHEAGPDHIQIGEDA